MQSQVRAIRSVHGVSSIPMDTTYAIETNEHHRRIAAIVRQRNTPGHMPAKEHCRRKFVTVTACLEMLLRSRRRHRNPSLTGYDLEERLNQKFKCTFNSVELQIIFSEVAKILRRELKVATRHESKVRARKAHRPASRRPPAHSLPKETAC